MKQDYPITRHFTFNEMTKTTHSRYLDDNRRRAFWPAIYKNLHVLCDRLEGLRAAYGKPIYVNSGFRSKELNKAVGGVKSSKHCDGLAADIRGATLDETCDLLKCISDMGTELFSYYYINPKKNYIHVQI